MYSTRGVATGVSFTDQNAQFFAFDVLTVVSGLAAAFLVGGAFTRMIWPLGLTIGVWFLASLVIGRLYPEAIQRFTVEPNQFAQEERYIAQQHRDDPAGLRPRRTGRTGRSGARAVLTAGPRSTARRTRSATPGCGTTGRSRTRSTSSRPSAATTTSPTSTPTATSSTTSSARSCCPARELALDQNPSASGWVNQRIVYTHGIGVAMVPVNEVANEGQPRLFIGNLPPRLDRRRARRSPSRASTSASDRPTTSSSGAKQAEFDYPTGEGDDAAGAGTETRWTRHDRHRSSTPR